MPDTPNTEPQSSDEQADIDISSNTEPVESQKPQPDSKETASPITDPSDDLVNQIDTVGEDSLTPPADPAVVLNDDSTPELADPTLSSPVEDEVNDTVTPDIENADNENDTSENTGTAYDVESEINTMDDSANSDDTPSDSKFHRLLKNKWFWIILVVILAILFGVPYTRYKVLGLAVRESVKVDVTDSSTHTPVSDAQIKLGGRTIDTDAEGVATIRVPLGPGTLVVTKQYYKTYSAAYFTSLAAHHSAIVHLDATGRQVPLLVENTVTGQPIAGAEVKVLNTTARTSSTGKATIVLPTTQADYAASVQLGSYNTVTFSMVVSSSLVASNIVTLTPAGQLYFLSNLSGTIDVVKTDLDGTDAQTVLAGTGQENPNTTALIASQDWHYLVLKAQRSGSEPALYLINTSDDKVTEFDDNNADFTPVGWSGHNFVYDEVFNNVPASQNGHEELKSYDADTGQLNLLDENQTQGTSTSYAYQGFYDFYLIDGMVVYDTQWNTTNLEGSNSSASSLTDTIRAVEVNGQGKKDYETFPIGSVGYIQTVLAAPQTIYFAVYDAANSTTTYYSYTNEAVSSPAGLNQAEFTQTFPDYLFSPSNNRTLYSTMSDGVVAIMTADQNGLNTKQLLRANGYQPYGWYGENYVLLSQNNDKLYIMPAAGLGASGKPYLISEYYQSPETYTSIEYSYGAQ